MRRLVTPLPPYCPADTVLSPLAYRASPPLPVPLPPSPCSADTPQFFQSTKFFAVLDVEEAKDLFQATSRVRRGPYLF